MQQPMKALAVGTFSLAAVLAAPASTAFADTATNVTPFMFSLAPTTVSPGGDVALGVTGCDAGAADASSTIFPKTSLPSTGTQGEYVGTVTLAENAPAGTYVVTFTCGASSGTTRLTVSGSTKATGGAAPATATTPSATKTAATTTMPSGPPKTGVRGSVGSGNTALVATGAGATAAAVGVGAFALRRRRAGQD